MSLRVFILIFLSFYSSHHVLGQKSAVETSGDILQIALPATAAASTIFFKDGSKPGWQFAKSMLVSFSTTHILKRTIDRTRPNGGRYSFPSGHTSAAFTGAAFIHKRYGFKISIPAYALATYAGWTRVDSNKHYWTDIIGGAAVGVASAFIFTKSYKITENVQMDIGMIPYGEGLQINLNF